MSAVELINSASLASNTTSVTFFDIPQNYNDLQITVVGRDTWTTDTYAAIVFRFNNDFTSTYSNTTLVGNGTSVSSYRFTNLGSLEVARLNTSSSSNSIMSGAKIYIPRYTNTTHNKSVIGLTAAIQEAYGVNQTAGLWRSTSAINRIDLGVRSQFAIGTNIMLWGIK